MFFFRIFLLNLRVRNFHSYIHSTSCISWSCLVLLLCKSKYQHHYLNIFCTSDRLEALGVIDLVKLKKTNLWAASWIWAKIWFWGIWVPSKSVLRFETLKICVRCFNRKKIIILARIPWTWNRPNIFAFRFKPLLHRYLHLEEVKTYLLGFILVFLYYKPFLLLVSKTFILRNVYSRYTYVLCVFFFSKPIT